MVFSVHKLDKVIQNCWDSLSTHYQSQLSLYNILSATPEQKCTYLVPRHPHIIAMWSDQLGLLNYRRATVQH